MRTRGFSLVELMVALVIIAILASVLIPNLSGARRRAAEAAARAYAMEVYGSLTAYLAEHIEASPSGVIGSWPSAPNRPSGVPSDAKDCTRAYPPIAGTPYEWRPAPEEIGCGLVVRTRAESEYFQIYTWTERSPGFVYGFPVEVPR